MIKKKIPLIFKLLLGIGLGVLIGLSMSAINFIFPIQLLATFNSLFGNFLSFVVPLLVLSFVTMGIAELGGGAGKLLGISVGLAYASTVLFATLAMLASRVFFPLVLNINSTFSAIIQDPRNFLVSSIFSIDMPPALGVMSALILAFILGVGLAVFGKNNNPLYDAMNTFQQIIEGVIKRIIVPLLPIHIAGVFANMSYSGKAFEIMRVMFIVFILILSYHTITLIVHFITAGLLQKKNPLQLFIKMIPSYVTALGTQSSAASIPVNREQMKQAGVSEQVANFTAPLFANIHMPGSAITISTVAFALAYMAGMELTIAASMELIFMLAIFMVAAPGVPGGAVMAAVILLENQLGFSETLIALTIAMHLAQDSFGTACNVTADGALALDVDAIANRSKLI